MRRGTSKLRHWQATYELDVLFMLGTHDVRGRRPLRKHAAAIIERIEGKAKGKLLK